MRQGTSGIGRKGRALALGALCTINGLALAQTGISDNVVKIGVLTDFSGPYADANGFGSLRAAQMAVEDFGGSVLGKKVEVIYLDHQNKSDIASSKAREWYDREGVDMIVDLQNSAVALAVAKVAAEKKKVAIVVGAGTSRLTNEDCTPYTIHYAYNTAALANVAARAVVAQGGKSWYFITADYAFGHSLEQDASKVIKMLGGDVKGSARHPLNASDFSSFMLQAKASKAQVVGFANAGGDFVNSIKSAREFGITPGQQLAGLLVTISEVHTLGLAQAQDLLMADGWYWDMNAETRAFGKRFFEKLKRMPNMFQAGVYSATLSYLKAVKDAGTDNGDAVMKSLKSTRINDVFARNGYVRRDGAMVHDMYLAQVKKPSESKYPWDYYHIKATVKGEDAFQSPTPSRCPLP
jgi:branched-chain amino acid transport system substrate-binding protein